MGLEGETMPHRGGFTRGICLDFPYFEGDNPSGRIFKATQYFKFHQTPLVQRLLIASYHMEGEVLVLYQDIMETGQFTSWEAFVRALLLRFGPMVYDDMMKALTQLKQSYSVTVYKA